MTRPLRLLILSYYSPPVGGPGAQRPEKILRYLPANIDATVITATVDDYLAFSPLSMPLDLSRFRTETNVFRLSAGCPYRLFRVLPKLRLAGTLRWFYVPDVARKWAQAAVRLAKSLHQQKPFDVVFSTAPPFSTALAGQACARSLSAPWVCDLQDLWTGYLLGAWPSRFHHRHEFDLEKGILQTATITVMLTPGSRERILRRHSFLDPGRVECVTNGYDPSDFAAGAKPAGGKFVIVHTGVFCGPPVRESTLRRVVRGRAFQPRQVDRRAHSPEVLIRAMELLGDPRVEFRHLGPMDSENQRLFQSSRVQNLIKAVGYLEHRATLAELSSADAAYLCLATCLGEERNELVPQKTYEYLGARKPVLAPIQEGDAKDFLLGAGVGICTTPGDASALAGALRRLVEGKFAGKPAVFPHEDFCWRFEWSRLAARLFEIIDRAASGPPGVPENPGAIATYGGQE